LEKGRGATVDETLQKRQEERIRREGGSEGEVKLKKGAQSNRGGLWARQKQGVSKTGWTGERGQSETESGKNT